MGVDFSKNFPETIFSPNTIYGCLPPVFHRQNVIYGGRIPPPIQGEGGLSP